MELADPWLVAAWPGPGRVALTAAGELAQGLGAEPLLELPSRGPLRPERARIEKGVIQPPGPPRQRFHGWKNPDPTGPDLLILQGDRLPEREVWPVAQDVLQVAQRHGARRVITFAALVGTTIRRDAQSGVYVVASSLELLTRVRALRTGVGTLAQGEIAGPNGPLLASAVESGLEALCLLGNVPQLARNLSYPRAALSVLDLFGELSGISVDTAALSLRADKVDKSLESLLEHVRGLIRPSHEGEDDASDWLAPTDEEDLGTALDPAIQSEIEALFSAAEEDRDKALELKEVLDRHGVFKRYEDRFLDLFS